ncbi:MAG TPA: hypothetical protein VJO52_03465 [Gemmatimonadaceae bacterium]|nr:hypothetical protein [Gemmatimonadaceae bacterium]
MKALWMERVAWAVTAVAVLAGIRTWRNISRPADAPAPAIWPVSLPARVLDQDSLAVLAERITSADPFRLDRKPAAVAYGAPDTAAAHAAAQAAVPRPPLVLVGIVGPPWRALVDGIPGRDGSTVLHAGQTVAGLRVGTITGTTATISGMDTTWHLTVKRTWP